MDIFDFSFANRLGFLIAFIPGLFNLMLVGYILLFLPRNKLTNTFALLTLSLALWQFNDAVSRVCTSAAAADAWDCLFSPAWILLGALCLHFSILYSQLVKEELFRLFIALIYVPGFIFMGIYQAHVHPHIFLASGIWGWVNYYNTSQFDEQMIWWISVMVLISCLLLGYKTWKVRKDRLLRSQALLITIGIAAPTVAGIITQTIFPLMLNLPSIPVTSSFMTFFSLTTAIALRRFKLFSVSELVSGDALIESLPVMLFSFSETKRITYVNRYGKEKLGFIAEDIHGLDFSEVFKPPSPDQQIGFDQVWENALKGESLHNIEMSLITSEGGVDILVSANPIINNFKIQGVLFAARDITELKRSHQMVRHNEALLREAQSLAHIGSWEWDIVSNVVEWSDELFRIYGFKRGQVQVSYETYIERVLPEDRELVGSIIRRALTDHQPFEFYHRSIPLDSPGEIRIIQSRGRVTVDSNGASIRMNGTGQDVTLLKESEEKLRTQNIELQKIYSELDQFVYRVSHDLRSPLTSMYGLIDIAQSETNDKTIQQYLELLKSSVEEQDKFIRDILDHSRNSRMELTREPILFDEMIIAIIEHQKKLHDPGGLMETKVEISQHAPFFSDKNRMMSILKNLVSNAMIFSRGRQNPELKIAVDVTAENAGIRVCDNGVGIPPEQQDRVFDMFYRGSGLSVGSGLGLYIVRDTVQKLDGIITLESHEGEGSCFTISLPNGAG